MRKLVTIRRIVDIQPIKDKDLIVCAYVDGWTVVVQKDQFHVGDLCVYFEPDSFLPTGDSRWQMLVDKRPKQYEGQTGHVLKTIRLGGIYSNGFCAPLTSFPELAHLQIPDGDVNIDVTELLGIQKYDPPEVIGRNPAAKGNFPSFIPKTDEDRCQNLASLIFNRTTHVRTYADKSGYEVHATYVPKNTDDTEYELTIKMDGSSMTAYHNDGVVGVCSRNFDLKLDEVGNTFVDMFHLMRFSEVLPKIGNFAFQMELCGPGIQGNQEKFNKFHLFVFKVYNIDESRYVQPDERRAVFNKLVTLVAEANVGTPDVLKQLHHAPIIHERVTLLELGISNVADLLTFASGPSYNPEVKREGVVFKRYDSDIMDTFSFKAISESWLAAKKN